MFFGKGMHGTDVRRNSFPCNFSSVSFSVGGKTYRCWLGMRGL